MLLWYEIVERKLFVANIVLIVNQEILTWRSSKILFHQTFLLKHTDKLIQLFREYYMPKRNTYHSRGDFFSAKQEENETPEEHWKKLITLEKTCDFKDIKQEDLLISAYDI